MSSTWSILCASHEPAIEIADCGGSPEHAIERCAAPPPAHAGCDLLIARYSGGLVEIGCPPSRRLPGSQRHVGSWHPHDAQWVDADWLRLFAAAIEAGGYSDALDAAVARATRACWTPQRIARLASVLEV